MLSPLTRLYVGQFLLDDEHNGSFTQLMPANGMVVVETDCEWVVTFP